METDKPTETITTHNLQICLIGSGGSGKTGLAKLLTTRGEPLSESPITHNLIKYHLKISHDDVSCIPLDSPLDVNITDFGGEEVYRQLYPFHFGEPNKNRLYIVCYGLTTEVNIVVLQQHLLNITTRQKDAPILLVGTYCNMKAFDSNLPLASLKKRFPQIINDHDLQLSLTIKTKMDVSELRETIASQAMRMAHVMHKIPLSYLTLKTKLKEWIRKRLRDGIPPMCTKSKLQDKLRFWLGESADIDNAFQYLTDLEIIKYGYNKDTIILDCMWLINAFADVIVGDMDILEKLPASLRYGGILKHDTKTLRQIWTNEAGFDNRLRRRVLTLMHRFGYAIKVIPKDGTPEYSIIPSMLPPDSTVDTCSLDWLIGPITDGITEVGTEFHLKFIPPDLWLSLLNMCGKTMNINTCTRTDAVLRLGKQRGHLSINESKEILRLTVRGTKPTKLRFRVYEIIKNLLSNKYPHMNTIESLHVICHICHRPSQLYGRPLKDALRGRPFYCVHCSDDVELDVNELEGIGADKMDSVVGVVDADDVDEINDLGFRSHIYDIIKKYTDETDWYDESRVCIGDFEYEYVTLMNELAKAGVENPDQTACIQLQPRIYEIIRNHRPDYIWVNREKCIEDIKIAYVKYEKSIGISTSASAGAGSSNATCRAVLEQQFAATCQQISSLEKKIRIDLEQQFDAICRQILSLEKEIRIGTDLSNATRRAVLKQLDVLYQQISLLEKKIGVVDTGAGVPKIVSRCGTKSTSATL